MYILYDPTGQPIFPPRGSEKAAVRVKYVEIQGFHFKSGRAEFERETHTNNQYHLTGRLHENPGRSITLRLRLRSGHSGNANEAATVSRTQVQYTHTRTINQKIREVSENSPRAPENDRGADAICLD